jgi:hypothetical protein
MNTQTDHTRFLRRHLQLDGIASGLCGARLLFAMLEVVGLTRLREMVG